LSNAARVLQRAQAQEQALAQPRAQQQPLA
jgi:hypothetical protein